MHDHSTRNIITQRKSRYKVPFILFLCACVMCVIALWYIGSRVLIVRNIVCEMDGGPCSESVLAELARFHNVPLFFLQTNQVKKKLFGALPYIERIEFVQKFPQTLQVTLFSSNASLVLFFPENNTYAFLSPQGKITHLTPTKPEKTLFISLPGRTGRIGDVHAPEELRDFIVLRNAMEEHTSLYGAEWKNAREIIIFLPEGRKALLSSNGLEKQITTLQLLLNEATMIERILVIDLRFAHPVLR